MIISFRILYTIFRIEQRFQFFLKFFFFVTIRLIYRIKLSLKY